MKLALFPLHTVLFPGMALPLHIFEPRYLRMIGNCLTTRAPFGIVLIRSGSEVGGGAIPYPIGTSALITRHQSLPDGRLNIEALGQERFRIVATHEDEDGCLRAVVEPFPLLGSHTQQALKSAKALAPLLGRYLSMLSAVSGSRLDPSRLPRTPAAMAYLAAIVAQIPMPEKQELLAMPDALALLSRERALYRREVSLLRSMLAAPKTQERAGVSLN